MVPRVLTVLRGPDMDDVEPAIAADGDSALALLRRERFDAVLLDLSHAPLDGWCVLAAVGSWVDRPRLVAIVTDRSDIDRAVALGADLCVAAGTDLHARALQRSTKEMQCPRTPETSSRRPTTSGVSA